MTNLGKWSTWYQGVDKPQPYGETTSYLIAAEFLADCYDVQDWGCGKGFFRTVCKSEYLGIDGTETPFSDVVADLTTFRSSCDGVLLRHVLEHNFEWKAILDNAIDTAAKKLVIILFTPMSDHTHQIAWNPGVEVPDISFSLKDILGPLKEAGAMVSVMNLKSNTQYREEIVIKGWWSTDAEGTDA